MDLRHRRRSQAHGSSWLVELVLGPLSRLKAEIERKASLEAADARAAVIVNQGRTAAVALNGSGLVAFAALAQIEVVPLPALAWAVGLLLGGLIAGVLASVHSLFAASFGGMTALLLSRLMQRLDDLDQASRCAEAMSPAAKRTARSDARDLLKKTRLGFQMHLVGGAASAIQGWALVLSLCAFIVGVSVPSVAFIYAVAEMDPQDESRGEAARAPNAPPPPTGAAGSAPP